MGIKNMNKYLKQNAPSLIQNQKMSDLAHKTVVIDSSIYLFKYVSNNSLLENFYNMISIFRSYHITPIFVFDGKTPEEKREMIEKRFKEKKDAINEYYSLKEKLRQDETLNDDAKEELTEKIMRLKKSIVYLKKGQIEDVKELLDAYGVEYLDAVSEADNLCVQMVLEGKAWACVSDDMDMFVYGCPRVIRYLSLTMKTYALYETSKICEKLGTTLEELREVCVLSGTDYNIQKQENYESSSEESQKEKIVKTFGYAIGLFKKYKKDGVQCSSSFYEWLVKEKHIKEEEVEQLLKVCKMFEVSYEKKGEEKAEVSNKKCVDKVRLMNIMSKEGFLWV
jgi:5'-3' exonuclease